MILIHNFEDKIDYDTVQGEGTSKRSTLIIKNWDLLGKLL